MKRAIDAVLAENRRLNLQLLVNDFGSLQVIKSRIGHSPTNSSLNQILNRTYSTASRKTPRVMGNALARTIEEVFQLGKGWMDEAHNHVTREQILQTQDQALQEREQFLLDKKLQQARLQGQPMVDLLQGVSLSEWLVATNTLSARQIAEYQYRVVYIDNNNLEPWCPVNSAMVIDTTVKAFARNGVYLLESLGVLELMFLEKTEAGILIKDAKSTLHRYLHEEQIIGLGITMLTQTKC